MTAPLLAVALLALTVAALLAVLATTREQRDTARRDAAYLGEEVELYRDAAHRANTDAGWRD